MDKYGGRGGSQGEQARPILTNDDLAARRSVALLGELGPFTMLPGHGKLWWGTMAEAIEAAGVARLRPGQV